MISAVGLHGTWPHRRSQETVCGISCKKTAFRVETCVQVSLPWALIFTSIKWG